MGVEVLALPRLSLSLSFSFSFSFSFSRSFSLTVSFSLLDDFSEDFDSSFPDPSFPFDDPIYLLGTFYNKITQIKCGKNRHTSNEFLPVLNQNFG